MFSRLFQVTARTSEEASFTISDIQIRQYQDLLIAETVIEASCTDSGSIGFNRLAGYILATKMSMTAPVLREQDSKNRYNDSDVAGINRQQMENVICYAFKLHPIDFAQTVRFLSQH